MRPSLSPKRDRSPVVSRENENLLTKPPVTKPARDLALDALARSESLISWRESKPVVTREEPKSESGWIKTADRPPTKEDANEKGRVLWGEVSVVGIISQKIGYWDTARPYLFWLPIPPVPGVDAEKK